MTFGKNKLLNREKSGAKQSKFYILAFFCAFLVLGIVYLMAQIWPLGKITILRMDLYHQYGPLFAELYERLTNGDSMIYSWCSGLGSCFLGNYFNYLSSPIAGIIVLLGRDRILESIALMIIIKAALSSTAFNYYLAKSQKKLNYSTVAFGVMYAFCGYFLAYYWNLMWIDAMVLLPIVAYGIERIINTGKMRTYVTGLALTMFSNYYMSFMMCLFSVIYFLAYFYANYNNGDKIAHIDGAKSKLITWMKTSRFIRSGTIFAFGSFAAAGLIAFALLPTFMVLQSSSATSGTLPDDLKLYFNAFDFLANHLSGVSTTIRSSGNDVLPNVMCGMLTVLLLPLYVMTKSISKKEKIVYLTVLGVFYIGFNLNFFNFFWHAMHFPNDLPYRQSFMYSFILLVIAFKTFTRLKEFTSRQITVTGICVVLFIIIAQKVGSKNLTDAAVYVSMFFAILYTIILVFFKDRRYASVSLAMLMLVCVCSEILIADTTNYDIDQSKENFASDYNDFADIKDYLDELEDDGFYRMELAHLRARMDPCWYYYNGVSTFSSMAYERVASLQHKLGMFGNTINSYTYYPQTPIYNAFFSLKYVVNNKTPNIIDTDKEHYSYLTTIDKFTAYEVNYDLPIAFRVNKEMLDWDYNSVDPFEVQGSMFASATGESNPFAAIPIDYVTYSNMNTFGTTEGNFFSLNKTSGGKESSCTFYFSPEKSGNVYFYLNATSYYNTSAGEGKIKINTAETTIDYNLDMDGIIDIGYVEKGEPVTLTVTLTAESKDSGSLYVYAKSMDSSTFQKGYEKLDEGALNITKFDDTVIEGKINIASDGIIYTSIPYDTGWSVYIDGVKAQYAEYDSEEETELLDVDTTGKVVKIGNSLMGIGVTAGEHEITFKYNATGLSSGLKLSVFTLLIIIAFFLLKKFGIIEKVAIKLDVPEFAEKGGTLTNDLFIGGDDAYDDIVEKTVVVTQPTQPAKTAVERELITPPSAISHPISVPAEQNKEAASSSANNAQNAETSKPSIVVTDLPVPEKVANVTENNAPRAQAEQNNTQVYHALVDEKESFIDRMKKQRGNK